MHCRSRREWTLQIAALALFATCAMGLGAQACAQEAPPPAPASEAEKLANQLANPISSLISMPLQLNWNTGGGYASNGNNWTLNVQPVIPFSISEHWNVISRTIVPLVTQSNITPPQVPKVPPDYQTGQTGIGDPSPISRRLPLIVARSCQLPLLGPARSRNRPSPSL
jgi:hypothetical protein